MTFKLEKNATGKVPRKQFDLDSFLKYEVKIFKTSFSNKKKEAFYTELAILLKAGISLKDSLSLIVRAFQSKKDQKIFNGIIEELIRGANFSSALALYKDFTEYEYYSIKIGEETGILKQVTKELGLFFKRKNEQRRIVINALTYPIVILSTAFFAVLFMLKFVVPMFVDIFEQNNVELPWITKLIMRLSSVFQRYIGFFLMGMSLLIVFRKYLTKEKIVKKFLANLVLKIPFIGELVRKVHLAQFTQATALLTSAQVPILNSIRLSSKMIIFYPLQEGLVQVEQALLVGKSLGESMQGLQVFDQKMISLIKVADETNQNQFIFQRLTEHYNDEIQQKTKMLGTIMEPLIIIILGAIIAVILIAMYLPMFKLSSAIG